MKTNNSQQFLVINPDGTTSTHNGDNVCCTFNVNSVIHNGQMICNANLRTHLYDKDEQGNYIDSSASDDRTLFVNDIFNCNDKDIIECVSVINDAIQKLILIKNL